MDETKNFSVLYVEDEIKIREKYSQYLTRFISTVYVAQDGEEAYQVYQAKRPNILIADINLPKLSGLELAAKIREYDHNTKIIMLTAHSDVEYLLEATDLKLTKYLIKPVSREDLKSALTLAIDELFCFTVLSNNIIYLKDNCHWNPKDMDLYIDDKVVPLTKNEKLLTNLLISKLNITFKYEEIISTLWPYEYNDKFPALKTLVKELRRKLPANYLENIRSIGYKFKL